MVTKEEQTIQISDQQLHSALNEFLEEKEKKPKKSIWNISTITGLVLVFISAGYIGHLVGTELFGLSSFPLITTLMKVAPYFGGAMLGVLLLTMFVKNKEKKLVEQKEEAKARETYDKLDKFLYTGSEKKKDRTAASSKKASESFRVDLSNKIMRSRSDKKLAGVCGGLAKYLGISSTVMRLIFVAAVFLSSSAFILVYIALSFIIPKEPVTELDEFK